MNNKDILKKEKNPNEKKIRIFAFIGMLVSIFVGFCVATQTLAYNAYYWKGLGYEIAGEIYNPLAILFWYIKFSDKQPQLFEEPVQFGIYGFCMTFLLVVIIAMAIKSKLKGIETLHGSARWATTKELYDCSLLQKKEDSKPYVYVGGFVDEKKKMHYLRHSGPEHILCYAPTRSGKGVGLVIPTLVCWSESAVITDLKGELWALTAGYRQSIGQKVIKFEPAAAESAKWNPLSEIRVGTPHEVGDAQNLANMIVDPDGKGLEGNDAHWKKTAFALYTGLILHVLYKEKNGDLNGEVASMRTIDDLLSDTTKPIAELWKDMIHYEHLGVGKGSHPVVAAAGKDQSDRPADEGGSVLSTVKSNLSLYRDPIVTENTAHSDFKIRDIMNCNQAVSVYVVTQPNDKSRLKPLIRIFINMTVRLLADKMKFVNGRAESCNHHKLLMMLDEFPSLGKLDIMQESLAFVAGYGIKCYLICQDLSQLKNDYGNNESITSNCHIQNAYPPNRMDTAEYLSKMTGTTTVVKKAVTKSGKGLNVSTSTTMQEVQRPLLTPDECLRLKGAKKTSRGDIKEAGDMLVFVAGFPAIYGRQILFFQDKVFLKRTQIEAPEKSDTITENDRYKENEENKKLNDKDDKSENKQLAKEKKKEEIESPKTQAPTFTNDIFSGLLDEKKKD